MAGRVQYLCRLMPNDYKPDWDIYTCHIDETPAIIGLDLDLRRFAPLAGKPYLLHVAVHLNAPRPDGCPDGEEFGLLGEIEDQLVVQLSSLDAHFAGRIMSDGIRDFYFYTGHYEQHEELVKAAMDHFPGYRYETGMKEDKNWELYFDFLFPDSQEFQRIQNRKVLRMLKQHGDIEEKARHIDHWIFFPTEESRDLYWRRIQPNGFVVEGWPAETESDLPYGLKVSRTDRTDQESIESAVMPLWELARDMNGRYDGWETVIVAQ
jgi:uncharacterized protein (TIGR01619 family)